MLVQIYNAQPILTDLALIIKRDLTVNWYLEGPAAFKTRIKLLTDKTAIEWNHQVLHRIHPIPFLVTTDPWFHSNASTMSAQLLQDNLLIKVIQTQAQLTILLGLLIESGLNLSGHQESILIKLKQVTIRVGVELVNHMRHLPKSKIFYHTRGTSTIRMMPPY